MRTSKNELHLINKFYELLIWTAKHVAKFPRSHKFTLGDRLQIRMQEVLETLITAKYRRDRLELLQQVNLQLELLRFQFRAANDLKCLSPSSYGFAARSVNEVGQLVGAWIKTSRAADNRT